MFCHFLYLSFAAMQVLSELQKGIYINYVDDNGRQKKLADVDCWDGQSKLNLTIGRDSKTDDTIYPVNLALMFNYPRGNGGSVGSNGAKVINSDDDFLAYTDGIPPGEDFESVTFTAVPTDYNKASQTQFSHTQLLIQSGHVCPKGGVIVPSSPNPNKGPVNPSLVTDASKNRFESLDHFECWDGQQTFTLDLSNMGTGSSDFYPVEVTFTYIDLRGAEINHTTSSHDKDDTRIQLVQQIPVGAHSVSVQVQSTASKYPIDKFFYYGNLLITDEWGNCPGGGEIYHGAGS